MRVRLLLASSFVLVACSCASKGVDADNDTAVTPTVPAPAQDGGPKADAGSGGTDSAAQPPKNACDLADVVGVADVAPVFVVYASPSTVPPAMTGGALSGQYKVDGARVYLPSGSAGLVDPKKSTGSINGWASFSGKNYRMHLKAAFEISTVAGPQMQGTDTDTQGGFTVSGGEITLDHACDGALGNEADYSFKDEGGGRATILIKTPTPYGDTYLQLDAAKN